MKTVQIIKDHLEKLEITDDTFAEYILQIIDDDMDPTEQIEIISEFLTEATSEANLEQEKEWVKMLIELHREQKKKELEAIEREKGQERQTAVQQTVMVETRSHTKLELTKEQKKERELFLSKYGYEVYGTEEVNGEIEFVGAKETRVNDILHIRELNVSGIKEKEAKRKQELQQKHQKETLRNKEMQEKQRLEREQKKKGTQKREKVRG
jgi:hypothetical protein